ncbi:MAG TPA: GIY-YIG nuclease family protein [Pyrinomonadaceae bacterium]|nr:GIY-YIG nuclease family protein [Pyrinomonadaceae bacterium]
MKVLGKTIKLYLVEGVPSGIITAEVMNWTGKVTVCPRSQLSELAQRSEVKRTGIYILAGEDIDDSFKEVIYIGESENVFDRLKNHNSDSTKDFWKKTVIFTNKDANLTKGHIRYLESRLIQIAKEANRARLENGTNPEYTILPESDIADMEYFIEQIKLLLPILGLTFALPLSTLSKNQSTDNTTNEIQLESPLFELTYGGVEAYAQEINGEFIVFKGSTVRKKEDSSLKDGAITQRKRILREGKIIESPQSDYWILTENLPLTSPSTASKIVTGAEINGRKYWKLKDSNQTYGDWQESKLNQIKDKED